MAAHASTGACLDWIRKNPKSRQAATVPMTASATLIRISAPSMPNSVDVSGRPAEDAVGLSNTGASHWLIRLLPIRQAEHQAGAGGEDGQDDQRDRHGPRRFVDVGSTAGSTWLGP